MKISHIQKLIKKDILSEKYGASGTRFLNANDVMKTYNISYVSALKVLNTLVEDTTLLQIGKKNYTATGIAKITSDIYKQLHSQKKKRVGILLRTLNPFFSSITEMIYKNLEKQSIIAIIKFCDEQSIIETIKSFIEDNCCGIINFCFFYENKDFNAFIQRLPIPIVFVGQSSKLDRPSVLSDNYYAGFRAGKHLIESGYEDFYFVAHNSKTYNERLQGFQQCLSENSFSFDSSHIFSFSEESTARALSLIIKHSNKRIGIFCMHDLIGYSILNQLLKRGISIPEQVGLIGYDKLETGFNQIKLTSLHYSLPEMAEIACSLIVDYMMHPLKPCSDIKLKSILFARDTTKKY